MYIPRLKNKFETEIIKSMIDRFSYKTHMQVPRLLKICINQGLGKSLNDKKIIANSEIAPAIVGSWQKEHEYVPCRIFKNISYGKLGMTNSEIVNPV